MSRRGSSKPGITDSVTIRCVRASAVAIVLVLFCAGVQVRPDGQEPRAGFSGASQDEADTSPVVIVQPQEAAKPQARKDRMLTEEEAYDLVWDLPEVKKDMERILERGGVPFSNVSARPDPGDQPGGKDSRYVIRFQGMHAKDVLIDLLFSVDAFTGRVSVFDSSSGSFIPLEEWRRQRK